MTLETENNLHDNQNDGNVANVSNVQSTLDQISTLLSFEELREECAIQGMKENLSSILGCIRGIKSDLAKLHIQSNDIDYAERMAEALEYEDFYGSILEDIEDKNKK